MGAFAIVVACGSSDTSGESPPATAVPPSACVTPCTPGAQPCPGPVDGNCNGVWYCWSDMAWHCSPPDASAPGDGGYDAAEIEASLLGEGTGDGGADDGGGSTDDAPSDDGPSGSSDALAE